jgi:hypothetical protein
MSGCHSHLWGGSLEGRLDHPPRSHGWARAKDARRAVGELFPPNSKSIPHLTPYRRLISAVFVRPRSAQAANIAPPNAAATPTATPTLLTLAPCPGNTSSGRVVFGPAGPCSIAINSTSARCSAPFQSESAARVRSSCPSMSALSESYYPAHSRSGGQRVPDTDHAGRGGPTQRAPGFQADPYEPASGVRGWQGEAADERGGEGGLGDFGQGGAVTPPCRSVSACRRVAHPGCQRRSTLRTPADCPQASQRGPGCHRRNVQWRDVA